MSVSLTVNLQDRVVEYSSEREISGRYQVLDEYLDLDREVLGVWDSWMATSSHKVRREMAKFAELRLDLLARGLCYRNFYKRHIEVEKALEHYQERIELYSSNIKKYQQEIQQTEELMRRSEEKTGIAEGNGDLAKLKAEILPMCEARYRLGFGKLVQARTQMAQIATEAQALELESQSEDFKLRAEKLRTNYERSLYNIINFIGEIQPNQESQRWYRMCTLL